MNIILTGDSAGFYLASKLALHIQGRHTVHLMAPNLKLTYPEITSEACNRMLEGEADRAVLVCGTGLGVCIAANKIPGIRCALAHDIYSIKRSVLSNNANVLALGARVIAAELACELLDTWLGLCYDPEGRSAANVAALDALDRR